MNPIENTLVIMVGELTIIRSIPPQPHHEKFPMWTYRLTSIVSLPDPEDTLTRYTDVMGVIRGISSIATLTRPCRNFPASRRHILLDDGSGNEVRVTLWGESAYRFNEGVIRFLAEDQSAAIIFVGPTISMVQGSDACRWYINEDIEETNVLQTRLLSSFRRIVSLPLPWQITLRAAVGFTRPKDALSVLYENNFVQNQASRFRCVVRI